MKLYVCYGTWTAGAPLHRHPCGEAYKALKEAGHKPRVTRTYGLGLLGDAANKLSPGRRKVQELTGNSWVPVLVLDDDTVIQGSPAIIAWARDGDAAGAAVPGQPEASETATEASETAPGASETPTAAAAAAADEPSSAP
jgi:hypothetical protein